MVAIRRTPSKRNRIALIGIIGAVALSAIACSGGSPSGGSSASSQVVVSALLSDGRLTVLSVVEDHNSGVSPAASGYDPALTWTFQDGSGTTTAAGMVIDPRAVVAEFDANLKPDRVVGQSGSALVELRVPNTGGTLFLSEMPGVPGMGAHLNASAGVQPIAAGTSFRLSTGSGAPGITPQSLHALSGGGSANAPRKIVDHGSSARVNILLVPEGYTTAEQSKFNTDAMNAANGMAGHAGYRDHWNQFNVWVMDGIASNDSGITDPGCSPAGSGYDSNCPDGPHAKVIRDTAFGETFGDNTTNNPRRLVTTRNFGEPQHPENWATLASAKQQVGANLVGLVVNTTEWGGAGDFAAQLTFTTNTGADFLLAHEAGHSLFHLHDEYEYGTCGALGFGPNTSKDPSNPPWKSMMNTQQIPTSGSDLSVIGAFVGADYCATGAYRGQANCMMRAAGAEMCAVCRHQMDVFFGTASQDGGADGSADGSGSPPAAEGGADGGSDDGGSSGYAFLRPRGDERHHALSPVGGGSESVAFVWRDAPGLSAPADLWVDQDGRPVLQVYSESSKPFVRVGLDTVPLLADTTYRVMVERAEGQSTIELVDPTGGVVLRGKLAEGVADVVLPPTYLRSAVTLEGAVD